MMCWRRWMKRVSGRSEVPPQPLPSEDGTAYKALRTLTGNPRLESGLDCRMCSMFDPQRSAEARAEMDASPRAARRYPCLLTGG